MWLAESAPSAPLAALSASSFRHVGQVTPWACFVERRSDPPGSQRIRWLCGSKQWTTRSGVVVSIILSLSFRPPGQEAACSEGVTISINNQASGKAHEALVLLDEGSDPR